MINAADSWKVGEVNLLNRLLKQIESKALSGLFLAFGAGLLFAGMQSAAFAAGGDPFKDAACNLFNLVLEKDFGAMATVIAGALAIVASIVGSFKGAWALVFVSVGCYIAEELVQKLFPMGC